jgi:hypothetical protein
MYPKAAARADRRRATEHRRRLLARLSGRVVELGAGNGLNFPHYPATVTQVVAIEPEPSLRAAAEQAAAQRASVTVTVRAGTADQLPLADGEVDAAVASLVLCSVPDQASALAELHRVLRPGGELRFYEHVIARCQPKRTILLLADRSGLWPAIAGGCHPPATPAPPSRPPASPSNAPSGSASAPARSSRACPTSSASRGGPETRSALHRQSRRASGPEPADDVGRVQAEAPQRRRGQARLVALVTEDDHNPAAARELWIPVGRGRVEPPLEHVARNGCGTPDLAVFRVAAPPNGCRPARRRQGRPRAPPLGADAAALCGQRRAAAPPWSWRPQVPAAPCR